MQIDNFPEKVDRLLNSISKVYFDQDSFDSIFDSQKRNDKERLKMMMKDNNVKSKMARAQLGGPSNYPKPTDVEMLEKEIASL